MRKSRYVWAFQSRRSLLVWKIFGARLDGLSNDDFPIEAVPGDPSTLQLKGKPLRRHAAEPHRTPTSTTPAASCRRRRPWPAPTSGPDGKKIKVAPLSDEDRLTLVRWIDLGCPIDLDYDPAQPERARLRLDAGRQRGRR